MRYRLIKWILIGTLCFYSSAAISFFGEEGDEPFDQNARHVISTIFGVVTGGKISYHLDDWLKPQAPVTRTIIWVVPSIFTIWGMNKMISFATDEKEKEKAK